jgi:hypothetical protein
MLTAMSSEVLADPRRVSVVMREWERSFEGSLQVVYLDMRRLSASSKQIDGKRFYIECYDKRAQGYGMTLRWRGVDLQGHKHTLWTKVEMNLHTMPDVISNWYIKSNKDMEWLNMMDKTIRGMLKQTMVVKEYSSNI